ncbi:MAG: T9SS type A sorting domain-containing protein [Bacteroidia bacterium]|nr:T9SS type A sorting domain-containing protein [Bacteroidia bacterium]
MEQLLFHHPAGPSTISGLFANVYWVTVTDANSCSTTNNYIIIEPAPITYIKSSTPVTCFGGNNGTAVITVISGGTPDFTFSWSNGQIFNHPSISKILAIAGTYYVTITDAVGCSISTSFQITQPPKVMVTVSPTQYICTNGFASIYASATGGHPGYVYTWSTGQTTGLITVAPEQTTQYNVFATDISGCTSELAYVKVVVFPPLSFYVSVNTDTICPGEDVTFAAHTVGGMSPYTYTLSPGISVPATFVVHPSATTSYSITVSDVCETPDETDEITIYVMDSPSNSFIPSITSGCTPLTVKFIETNPQDNRTFYWDFGDPGGLNHSTYKNPYHIYEAPGDYSVVLMTSSEFGCTTQNIMENLIHVYPTPEIIFSVTNATCGQSNGTATVTASGGTPPYFYQWSNGDTGPYADSLHSGLYTVTVTDITGCSITGSVNISDNEGATIQVVSVTDVSCPDGHDGAANISISGGFPPYLYEWSTGAVTEDLSGIPAGTYQVMVTGFTGCVTSATVIISQPDAFDVVITTINSTCGIANGSASATVTGGTSPYSYLWSTGATETTATGLFAGVYVLTITDNNSCYALYNAHIAVSDSSEMVVVVDTVYQAGCGTSNGAVYITVTGSVQLYTYNWSDGSTNQDLMDIDTGIYTFTVTDALGCKSTLSEEVSAIEPLLQPICMVSVDSAASRNMIIWEKVQESGITHYNIYREIYTDVFYEIAEVLYDSMSVYIDEQANPATRSWRYRISAVDNCGNESALSEPHKTMHLTLNVGLNQTVNLIWDKYEGFPYSLFHIYRFSNSSGWVTVDSLPTSSWTFTDTPPNWCQLWYRIAVVKEEACYPTSTDKAQGGPYSQSFSNLDDNGVDIGIMEIELPGALAIYPNPFTQQTTIVFSNPASSKYTLEITELTGRTVHWIQNITSESIRIDKGNLAPGCYLIELRGDRVYRGKVITR